LHAAHTRRLALDVPMDIRVLDTGGGVAEGAGSQIASGQIRCLPLLAFLAGLTTPGSWSQEPAVLSLRDVIGGLRHSFELLSQPGEAALGNLAVVSELSLNLSLRLGYHFSVIDAHLSNSPLQNTVYFRFVGGLADERRRERRARLIRIILEGLGFLVENKGDLVTARIRGVSREDMEQILTRLGQLTAFTRQGDTAMGEDADVERLGDAFLQLDAGRSHGGPSC
jgi:pyruvate,water dikinase